MPACSRRSVPTGPQDLENEAFDSVRDELYFLLGRYYYGIGDLGPAIALLSQVPRESDYFIPAQYFLGVSETREYHGPEAVEAFKNVLRKNVELRQLQGKKKNREARRLARMSDKKKRRLGISTAELDFADQNQRFEELANIALGYIFYQVGKFDTSLKYFNKISIQSPYWLDAVFAASWSEFRLVEVEPEEAARHYQRTLGYIHTLNAPFFYDYLYPEGLILKAVTYYFNCRYAQAKASIEEFSSRYVQTKQDLSDLLNSAPEDTGWTYTTDGLILVAHDESCNAVWRCPLPLISSSGWTGLDISESLDRAYFTDAVHLGYYHFDGSCPIGPIRHVCRAPAQLNTPLTGITLDNRDQSVWVCDASGQVANVVFNAAGGCTVRRIFRVSCPNASNLLSLRGITLHGCRDLLYVTDNMGTVAAVTTSGNVLRCCRYQRVQPARFLVGLDLDFDGGTVVGRGCTGPNCPPCMPEASLRGLPTLPSRCFGVRLDNAPTNGRAVLMLNIGGPCPTIPIAGLCGPLYIGAPNWFSPMMPITPTGAGLCDGSAFFSLPIPNNYFLCGLEICAQWLTLCPAGGLGISNGVHFRLQG